MTNFREDDVVLLLGAGASVEAAIPSSAAMNNEIEAHVQDEWAEYRDLYYLIKSAIHYAEGIDGRFSPEVNFNIERLVNTLEELDRKNEHPLYPFIGSWNVRLLELAGPDFRLIGGFRQKIIEELRKWVTPKHWDASRYFSGVGGFVRQYNFPLRIFTLNYDLCVEKNAGDLVVERGFGDDHRWDWRRFEDSAKEDKNIFLYKLHGSIDWEKRDDGTTIDVHNAEGIPHDALALIFGTSYKLQYIDPFLFLAYEFRKWTLEARLILSVGYGFGDEHVNGILGQALNQDRQKMLVTVGPTKDIQGKRDEIAQSLGVSGEQIQVENQGAKDFMLGALNVETVAEYLPAEEQLFDEG